MRWTSGNISLIRGADQRLLQRSGVECETLWQQRVMNTVGNYKWQSIKRGNRRVGAALRESGCTVRELPDCQTLAGLKAET